MRQSLQSAIMALIAMKLFYDVPEPDPHEANVTKNIICLLLLNCVYL